MKRLLLLIALLVGLLPSSAPAQDTTVLLSYHAPIVVGLTLRVSFSSGCEKFDIVNRGTTLQDVYFRIDGVDPTIKGDPAFVVAGNTMRTFPTGNLNNPGALTVRMVSSAATPISLECQIN